MNLHITIDSASNYRRLDEVNGVKLDGCVVPLKICTDEKEFIDDADLDINDMVSYLEGTKLPSHSACPGIDEWLKSFGDHEYVIGITLASILSGSYNACRVAAEQYMEEHEDRRVYVLDTTAIGPVEKLCIEYIANKEKADPEALNFKSAEEFDSFCKELDEYCHKNTKIGFALKSLKNLANNGRINKAVAKIAETLKIHIVGDFSETGVLQPKNKVRGDDKTLRTLVEAMKEAGYKGGRFIIDHCLAAEDAESLKALVLKEFPNADITIAETTGLCTFYAERGGLVLGYEIEG